MTPSERFPLPPLARPGVDRSADERADAALLDVARADRATRVLVIVDDAAPMAAPDALRWVSPSDVPDGAQWAFLGREETGEAMLAAVFARSGAEPFTEPVSAPSGWAPLRSVGGGLGARDAAAFVAGLSLGRWLLDAPFCPACGSRTRVRLAGWSRQCPGCGREHFPRTDPAVIVAVTSARDPDLLLLGSNAAWGANRYSCFAGFVEAGESLESTVVREVREEAGVDVVDLRFRGSQAWPYPRSIMIGFIAVAADDDSARPDGEEIVAVRWFSRDEIGAGLAGRSDLLLPGPASIAHALISDWHAGRA